MKKLVSVLLSVIMIVSMFASSVVTAADLTSPADGEVTPNYEAGSIWTSILTFSGTTAKCKSSIILASDETWKRINQRLEKEISPGKWEMVPGASWNAFTMVPSDFYIFNNSITVTSSGKYRVKSTFDVESAAGVPDTIIAYSQPVALSI